MPAERILDGDTLKVGKDKLNKAIEQANKSEVESAGAVVTSVNAVEIAKVAKASADSTRTELDAVVNRATDTDAMSRQAAVAADGIDKLNLKKRLDDDYIQVFGKLLESTEKSLVYLAFFPKQDSEADDTERIKRAIAIGGNLIFERRVYEVSDTLEFLAHTNVNANGARFRNGLTVSKPLIHIRNDNIDLDGLTIENTLSNPMSGTNWGEFTYKGSPILLSNFYGEDIATAGGSFNNVSITNVNIENSIHNASAVCVFGLANNVKLENINVYGNGTDEKTFYAGFNINQKGEPYRHSGISMRNCRVYDLAGEAKAYNLSASRAVSMYTCKAKNVKFAVTVHVGDAAGSAMAENEVTIAQCEFEEVRGYAFHITASILASRSDMKYTMVSILGNRIIGKTGETSAVGVRIGTSKGGLSIKGNYFDNLACGIFGTYSTGADIDQNTFDRVIYNQAFPESGRAISFTGCNSNDIGKNEFNSIDREAIRFIESSRNRVKGNRLRDVYKIGNTTVDHTGISIDNLSSDNLIDDSNEFGYEGQVTKPYKWISIKNASSNMNKILLNIFYACASGVAIYNGTNEHYLLVTMLNGNTLKSTDSLYSGANPLVEINVGHRVFWGGGPPTSGAWKQGEKVLNRLPTAGSYEGWICVAPGTSGTWRGFGLIQA